VVKEVGSLTEVHRVVQLFNNRRQLVNVCRVTCLLTYLPLPCSTHVRYECVSSCPPTIKACQLQRGHHKNHMNRLTWEVNGGMNDSCSHRLIFVKLISFKFHTKGCEDVHWQIPVPVSRFFNCNATIDHIPSHFGRPGVCSQSVGTPSWVLFWL